MTITDRRKEILGFIAAFQAQEGLPPSIRETCKHFGLNSAGSMSKHLKALGKEGLLENVPGKSRAWKLTEKGWNFIGRPRSPHIPMVGQIAAGTPILAEENREDDLPVDPSLFGSGEAFALRVKGDSMQDAQIRDGDLAVIQPRQDAQSGAIVAVMVEGTEQEATLKTLRRRRGRVELHPENEDYDPMIFRGKEMSRVRILGELIGVIRLKP
ncbi:transcriptional repressor LexA [Thermodesulfobacteriota bacterium]